MPMNTSNGAKAGSTATDPARGMALLRDPLLNKGTAFTEQERIATEQIGQAFGGTRGLGCCSIQPMTAPNHLCGYDLDQKGWCRAACSESVPGHSLPSHSAPVRTFVCCYSN